MAYFKKLEVDEFELEDVRRGCLRALQLVGAVEEALDEIGVLLQAAASFLGNLEFRVGYAEEVDPNED